MEEKNSLLKSLIEIIPLIIFFIINAKYGIIIATKSFVVATLIALLVSYLFLKKVSTPLLITSFLVLIFGGLTIFLKDPTFIKLKPTIVYLLFSFFLFFGLILKKNFLKIYLSNLIKLNDIGWNILTKRWGIFFIVLALLNEFIWRNFSTDFWVSFKVFGFLPITIIFTFLQKSLIEKYKI
ncbi:MAG: Intracellular septation protein [Alphaproteobacteria bacterium MarineAlpha6_Bin4]|nr:MAG: Intracellular septation protein [Alphaproteobacteria bacterium MarineAlpha6_Bin4]|tara:strand:+ start:4296 stop:4838 length:543 start_codon:yes stop_codon:yes gene_type:complete